MGNRRGGCDGDYVVVLSLSKLGSVGSNVLKRSPVKYPLHIGWQFARSIHSIRSTPTIHPTLLHGQVDGKCLVRRIAPRLSSFAIDYYHFPMHPMPSWTQAVLPRLRAIKVLLSFSSASLGNAAMSQRCRDTIHALRMRSKRRTSVPHVNIGAAPSDTLLPRCHDMIFRRNTLCMTAVTGVVRPQRVV